MALPPALPIEAVAGGVRIGIRLTPGARADRLYGIAAAPTGPVLQAAVAAPPEAGRANAALAALLARACGVPPRAVAILRGHRGRYKLVQIAGDPAVLRARLAAALTAARR